MSSSSSSQDLATITPLPFTTGFQIYQTSILPAILSAQHEVILITCFWSTASETLARLRETLLQLSKKSHALQQQRKKKGKKEQQKKIKVRIGFSSSSVWQKLTHTSSKEGKVYSGEEVFGKRGLLSPSLSSSSSSSSSEKETKEEKEKEEEKELWRGLDLEIKSIFFLPFSVWHPKFVIVDRKEVWLPSCNVSWEEWFEGGVRVQGEGVVRKFVEFWEENWRSEGDEGGDRGEGDEEEGGEGEGEGEEEEEPDQDQEDQGGQEDQEDQEDFHHHNPPSPTTTTTLTLPNIPYKFLPSPHHRNPHFHLFPWQTPSPAPPTPLNLELLHLFTTAHKSIYIQTPNLTCAPVLDALWGAAVERGVQVTIVTSERLMRVEQLVTAGRTTGWCVRGLVKRYQRAMLERERRMGDLEAGSGGTMGSLRVSYYEPRSGPATKAKTGGDAEPVQSHLKLTVVDEEAIVFGSGNMDRASWYTSQELGVAFYSHELVTQVMQSLQSALEGRTKLVYDSSTQS